VSQMGKTEGSAKDFVLILFFAKAGSMGGIEKFLDSFRFFLSNVNRDNPEKIAVWFLYEFYEVENGEDLEDLAENVGYEIEERSPFQAVIQVISTFVQNWDEAEKELRASWEVVEKQKRDAKMDQLISEVMKKECGDKMTNIGNFIKEFEENK